MSSMESLDKLQAELSGNVYGDAFHRLYKLSQDVSGEHAELMAQAMKWVRKEKVEPLEAENAKLRELVLHMYTCMGNVDADGNHECFSCEYEGSECEYDCCMRELGIEVD